MYTTVHVQPSIVTQSNNTKFM